MRKPLFILSLVVALGSVPALAGGHSGAVVGGALGGAAGSAIGYQMDGRDGAIVGAALGGALGVAIGSQHSRREVVVERPAYYRPVRETVIYRPAPPPRRVVVVDRYYGHGDRGWHRGWDDRRHDRWDRHDRHDHDRWDRDDRRRWRD